jgi:hypothetical protein
MPAGKLSGLVVVPVSFSVCPGNPWGANPTTPGIGSGFWLIRIPDPIITTGVSGGQNKGIPSDIARRIDIKIDDGMPESGMVMGDGYYLQPTPCNVASWCGGAQVDSCNVTNTTQNAYNTLNTGLCNLDFMNRF